MILIQTTLSRKDRDMKKAELDLVHVSPAQISEMKADINSAERMLKADIASGRPKIQDKAEFKAEVAKKQKILDVHAPKKFRGENANKQLKRAQDLKQRIIEAMPKSREYYQQYPKGDGSNLDFERAVKQQIFFQTDKQVQENVRHYKHIMRRIDPDDPTITNIELFIV